MSKDLLLKEAYQSYRFLMDHSNFIDGSTGYGLTLDRKTNHTMSSVCASGFMLSALVIGVERGWLPYEEGKKRAYQTLLNFYENIAHFKGFFIHFANFLDGSRHKTSEFSTIDTTFFINGMLCVDSYFNDEAIHQLTMNLFNRVRFDEFIKDFHGHKVFHMAYNDIQHGSYRNGSEDGWIYQWHMAAEQLCLYFLAAGSDKIDEALASELYYGFIRSVGGYKQHQFVYAPGGSLFTHQFSHAWFAFQDYHDEKGFDWFHNSVMAVSAQQQFCADNPTHLKTFNEYTWGVSACDGPKGYRGYGLPPYGLNERNKKEQSNFDGTIAPYAMVSSLPFVPTLVEKSYEKLLSKHPEIVGDYGLVDAFNFESGSWIDLDYLGIDKGISLLMIDNHYFGTTWKYYMQHPIIQKAIQKLNFQSKHTKG